jgi:hypothetical protein
MKFLIFDGWAYWINPATKKLQQTQLRMPKESSRFDAVKIFDTDRACDVVVEEFVSAATPAMIEKLIRDTTQ